MYKTIVHPTDLTEATLPALDTAHRLAKELGAKLLVCYLAHPPLVASGDELTNPENNETRNIAAELESYQPADAAINRELRIMIMESSTGVKTMLGFVEELECDLIVLGMHKRHGVAGWFASSITEEVVRRASCAVLVVKTQGEDESDDDPSGTE